ncbi:MAG: DegT/DnrJ/EryC1/StrS family aminotransferase [Thermodesulfobacteriota bacterium]
MIPVFKPSFGEEELEALQEPFKTGWIGLGPMTREFEKRFAEYIGTRFAVAVNSGTAALHLALKVLNIEGMEVITTPMTFISTNHAILYNGGIPVFVDIEPDTLNINPTEIEKNITPKTKVLLVVHYGGHACDMDSILGIAKEKNISVVEDTAHGCGGEYKGQKLGFLGDFGCFSFHAVKNMSTGEGGMITTDDPELYRRLLKLRWMGISKDTWSREEKDEKYSWYYNVDEVGFKYHMNDIPAAIGLVQLKKLEKMNRRRKEITERYNEGLKSLKWLETPVIRPYAKPSHHNYVIKVEKRDQLNIYLQEKGISTGVHYIPNNHYEMYRSFRGDTPISDFVWKKLLTLPLFPDLKDEEVDFIIHEIKEFGKKEY